MADLQCHVTAYSVMGRIHVAFRVYEFTPAGESNLTLLQQTTDVPDDGETDPREYLREALIAALEAL